MSVCPTCHRPLPERADAGGLHRALLDELAGLPGGATTRELRELAGRRYSVVVAALAMLEAEGRVVRLGGRARRWRLATTAA